MFTTFINNLLISLDNFEPRRRKGNATFWMIDIDFYGPWWRPYQLGNNAPILAHEREPAGSGE